MSNVMQVLVEDVTSQDFFIINDYGKMKPADGVENWPSMWNYCIERANRRIVRFYDDGSRSVTYCTEEHWSSNTGDEHYSFDLRNSKFISTENLIPYLNFYIDIYLSASDIKEAFEETFQGFEIPNPIKVFISMLSKWQDTDRRTPFESNFNVFQQQDETAEYIVYGIIGEKE